MIDHWFLDWIGEAGERGLAYLHLKAIVGVNTNGYLRIEQPLLEWIPNQSFAEFLMRALPFEERVVDLTEFQGLRKLPAHLPQVDWPWQADIPCPGVTVAIGRAGEQELVPEFIGMWVSNGWRDDPARSLQGRPRGVVVWVCGGDPERLEWTTAARRDGGFNLDMTRLIPTHAFNRDTMSEVGRSLDMAEALAGPGAGAIPLVVVSFESGTSFRDDATMESVEARLHETLAWLRPWAHARGVPVVYEVEVLRPGWTPAMSEALADRILARGGADSVLASIAEVISPNLEDVRRITP